MHITSHRSIIAVACVLMPFLAIFFNSNSTSAVESTLSLSIDNNTVSANSFANNPNGKFVKSSDSVITASTDNATGYTLKIMGTGATPNELANSSDNNSKLTSITMPITEESFKSINNTSYNGMWGYLPSKYNSISNNQFLPAPTTSGDIIDVTDTANVTANNYTLAIGARVDSSIKPGKYSNTYNVVLLANAIMYSFTYDDGITANMPTDEMGTSSSTTKAISSKVPTRNGYTFTGWCVGTVTNTNGIDSCNGTTYTAGSNYTLDGTTSNDVTFIAMWTVNSSSGNYVNVEIVFDGVRGVTIQNGANWSTTVNTSGTTIPLASGTSYSISAIYNTNFTGWTTTSGSIGDSTLSITTFTPNANATLTATAGDIFIQDFTNAMCQNQASSDSMTVYDRRDGNDYTVRYINGACWMTQNLRFTGTSLSTTTSNVTSDKTMTYYNIDSTEAPDEYYERCRVKLSGSSQDPITYVGVENACYKDSNSESLGLWYNYYAATAGTISGRSNSTTATQSICPKDWALPTKDQLYGIVTYPTSFVTVTGGYYNASGTLQSGGGRWWTATASGDSHRYYVYSSTNGASLNTPVSFSPNGDGRYLGYHVRCIRSN